MCSAYTEVGLVGTVPEDEDQWFKDHPDHYEYILEDDGKEEWRTSATIPSKTIKYYKRDEARELARGAGRKLKAAHPDRRVILREVYWCSGIEIEHVEEIMLDEAA